LGIQVIRRDIFEEPLQATGEAEGIRARPKGT